MRLASGSVFRPARAVPVPTRAQIVDQVLEGIQKYHAQWRLLFELKEIRRPKLNDTTAWLYRLPARSTGLVYHMNSKGWEGPFTFLHIEGKTDVVQLSSAPTDLRSTVVKTLVNIVTETRISSIPKTDNTIEENGSTGSRGICCARHHVD